MRLIMVKESWRWRSVPEQENSCRSWENEAKKDLVLIRPTLSVCIQTWSVEIKVIFNWKKQQTMSDETNFSGLAEAALLCDHARLDTVP